MALRTPGTRGTEGSATELFGCSQRRRLGAGRNSSAGSSISCWRRRLMPRLLAGSADCGRGVAASNGVGGGGIECDGRIYGFSGVSVGNKIVLGLREGVMVREPTEEGDKAAKAFTSNRLIS